MKFLKVFGISLSKGRSEEVSCSRTEMAGVPDSRKEDAATSAMPPRGAT